MEEALPSRLDKVDRRILDLLQREGALYETGPNSALDTTPLIGELLQAAGIASQRLPASLRCWKCQGCQGCRRRSHHQPLIQSSM